jgi:anthranilate synthase/aminodeoxychorismate synthase-like glutamine amidotransferase
MILFIDNYDSFVHNLARYFEQLRQEVVMFRNDQISVEQIRLLAPQAIVLSPGPCGPQQAGISLDLVRQLSDSIPILGVCLGHQVIAEAFGAKVVQAERPLHGRASAVKHTAVDLFKQISNPFMACRYHSLVVQRETVPPCLQITAETDDGTIMALQHRERLVFGLQFHPESILTDCGYQLLANFLQIIGQPPVEPLPDLVGEMQVC